MNDLDGSNAVVSVVQFYSAALARVVAERDQLQATLKQILERSADPRKVLADSDPERDALVEAAVRAAVWLMNEKDLPLHTMQIRSREGTAKIAMDHAIPLLRAYHDYERTRVEVGGVEPDPAREGPLRGAPAGGPTDVPG